MEDISLQLPLRGLIESLRRELRYTPSVEKYQQLLQALAEGVIDLEKDPHALRKFCTLMFLENHRDEIRFNEILEEAIDSDINRLREQVQRFLQKQSQTKPEAPLPNEAEPAPVEDKPTSHQNQKESSRPKENKSSREKTKESNPVEAGEQYLDHRTLFTDAKTPQKKDIHIQSFNQGDEYYPISRREIKQAWRWVRKTEQHSQSSIIDFEATINKYAQESMLSEPVYLPGTHERKNLLYFWVDRRGSMSPFHELCDRFVHTALEVQKTRTENIFYFQNYPLDQVYRQPSFKQAESLGTALGHASPHYSVALILSDAGAARGNRNAHRVQRTLEFVQQLLPRFAHVMWINPMPVHRWLETSAVDIALGDINQGEKKRPLYTMMPMVSIMENEKLDFQKYLKMLLTNKI